MQKFGVYILRISQNYPKGSITYKRYFIDGEKSGDANFTSDLPEPIVKRRSNMNVNKGDN